MTQHAVLAGWVESWLEISGRYPADEVAALGAVVVEE
jgi:hypothetical protein